MRQAIFALSLIAILASGSVSQSALAPPVTPAENLPGGEGTVGFKPFASFMKPAANLPDALKPDFYAGKALAHQPWVKAPTVTFARDGLGPVYNARTCLACHVNGGRGVMPEDGNQAIVNAFLRLSIPGTSKTVGAQPEPTYGEQLQSQSVALYHQLRHLKMEKNDREVAPEGYIYIDWVSEAFRYPDGSTVSLRKPSIRLENLGYGPLHPDAMMSLRNAPPMHGMGLLEQIKQADIDALADPNDEDGNGISGRVNYVWNAETRRIDAGRFGLKANRPSINVVTASAFQGDVGITNPVFPDQPCTAAQSRCLNTANGNDAPENVELPAHLLVLVADFSRHLGVPKRRMPTAPDVLKGRELFYASGCQGCHQPSYTTSASASAPHLGGQKIWPYSDLLLHDMGRQLADGRPDFEASGSEWRTAPLWGVGLSNRVNGSRHLLHDGRAQSVEEAILWHGGEAEAVKQSFIQLPAKDRNALIQFVESL